MIDWWVSEVRTSRRAAMGAPDRGRERWGYVILVVIVLLGVAAVAISSSTTTSSGTSSTTSSYSTGSQSSSGQAYPNVSAVYANLGYPKVTYSDYFTYLPSKPNFTMEYHGLDFGLENASVIGLNQAVALSIGGLNLTVPLQLGYATFYPGTIVNGTLAIHPRWYLFLAATYDGFWTNGSFGDGAFAIERSIDALNGTDPSVNVNSGIDLSSLPSSGHFELDVNSSRALATLRAEGATIKGVPAALTENGTVSFIEPRIVLLGPTSNNAAFQNPLDSSISGQKRLCWVIQLYYPTPGAGYQGTFAVDAETGRLVSGFAQNLPPNTLMETVSGSLNYSSAGNFAVSQEVFHINGSIIGRSGKLPVAVPNVLIIKPGSSSKIDLNFTSTFPDRSMNMSLLSFSNPLRGLQDLSADGLPAGVSAQFLTPSVVVPPNGTGVAAISISADENAPSGTYLMKLNAAWSSPAGGQSGVIFLLTVWNGAGQWPPPPGA
jgi:hypothetical protein